MQVDGPCRRTEHAVVLARKHDRALLNAPRIGQRIPARAAIEPAELGAPDILHAQIGMQRGGEIPGTVVRIAGVVHHQLHAQAARAQHHRQLRGKACRPPRECGVAVGQLQAHG